MFITANIVTFCGSVEEGRKKEPKAPFHPSNTTILIKNLLNDV